MQVKVEPDWSSAGTDHQIHSGYRVLDTVVETVYLDGNPLDPSTGRYYEVNRIEDESPDAIHLFS